MDDRAGVDPQFAYDRDRKEELFDRLGKKSAGLAGQHGDRDARIESDAIATHEDQRVRTLGR